MSPDRRDLSLKRVVDAIRPGPARVIVWDTARPGLGLDVWPSGRRSWVHQYRTAEGVQRRAKLGDARTMSPAQAGEAYLAAAARVQTGGDPLAEKRARRTSTRQTRAAMAAAGTVAEAGAGYVAHLRQTSRSDRWPNEVARIVAKNLGELAARPLMSLTTDQVRAHLASMKATPVSANRTRAVLSAVVEYARGAGVWPRATPNPIADVAEYPEQARDRYLRPDEWPRVARAIAELSAEYANAPAWDTRRAQLAALVTLALTGARLGAIVPRQWADVDVGERVLRVEPAHKGVTEVPLGLHALAHLESWRALATRGRDIGRAPCFPGQSRPGRRSASVASLAPMWRELRNRAKLDDFTLHDWRRTFATVAGDVGITDHLIGGLLGHVVPGIRGRYARRTPAALLDAADTVSAEIAARLGLTFAVVLPAPIRETHD